MMNLYYVVMVKQDIDNLVLAIRFIKHVKEAI
jgi:hypothetical protein